jgi:putative heme-binding domain-containing protein
VLSSAVHAVDPIVRALLREAPDTEFRAHFFANLIATSAGSGALADLALLSERLAPPPGVAPARWQLAGLAAVLEEARRRGEGLESLARTQHSEARGLLARLRGVLNAARGTASDEAAGDEDRTAALPLLGLDTAAEDDDLRELARLLDARQSPAVQSAALRAFARSRRDEAAGHLVAAWESAAPALRPQLTEALLSREVWTRRLVQAMEDGSVPPAEIDASRRERLIQHTVAELATRARKLFEPLGRPTRQELLEKYRHVLQLAGDRGQGAPVFARLCAACHAFKGQGKAVGPDLAALADRGAEALLIAVLDPNAAVEDKYLSFTLVAADGSVRSGMVAEETATSVALVQTDGSREVVLRKDIRSLRSTGKSLMPEGMEKDLDPQALADIVAYLQSGPRTLGSVTPAEAARARESLRALDVNGLDAVEGEGEAFPQPSWLGTVPMRYCRQTDGTWTLRWRSAPLAQDLPVGAAHRLRLAAAMGYRSQPAGGFQLRVNGRHVLDFDVAVDDAAWQSADGAVRMLYTVYANNSEDSTGVLAFELAPSLVEPGKPVELEVTGGAAGSQRWFGVLLWPGRG